MDREILFRGKCVNDGEWVYGYYAMMGIGEMAKHYIIQNGALCGLFDEPQKNMYFVDVEIDVNTLCQYAGLNDMNDTKIFEKDIISVCGYKNNPIGIVSFKNGQWIVEGKSIENMSLRDDFYFWATNRRIKVVGNIFDNPELEV